MERKRESYGEGLALHNARVYLLHEASDKFGRSVNPERSVTNDNDLWF